MVTSFLLSLYSFAKQLIKQCLYETLNITAYWILKGCIVRINRQNDYFISPQILQIIHEYL